MTLQTHQIPPKIDVDIRVYLEALLTSKLHRNFVRKWTQPKSAESIFAGEVLLFLQVWHVEDLLKIQHDLHPKNFHFVSQKYCKIDAKTYPRGYRTLNHSSKQFCSDSGCENVACWRHVDGQDGTKIMNIRCPKRGCKHNRKTKKKNENQGGARKSPLKPTKRATNYIRATQPANQPTNQSANQVEISISLCDLE